MHLPGGTGVDTYCAIRLLIFYRTLLRAVKKHPVTRETPAITGFPACAVRYLGYSFCAMLPGAKF
ncbi:hypothetical protein QFZ96_004726 [Paraburkholderia youngii]